MPADEHRGLTTPLRDAAEKLADVVEDFLFVEQGQDLAALRDAWQYYVDTAAIEDGNGS